MRHRARLSDSWCKVSNESSMRSGAESRKLSRRKYCLGNPDYNIGWLRHSRNIVRTDHALLRWFDPWSHAYFDRYSVLSSKEQCAFIVWSKSWRSNRRMKVIIAFVNVLCLIFREHRTNHLRRWPHEADLILPYRIIPKSPRLLFLILKGFAHLRTHLRRFQVADSLQLPPVLS